MILDIDQVTDLALAEVDHKITTARDDSKKLLVHFYGKDKTDYLTRIEGLESQEQLDLRRDHAISNRFLVEILLRPFSNVWSAKGGLIKVEIDSEQLSQRLKEQLENVRNQMSDSEYLKDIWSNFLFTDPMGLLFMEVSSTGDKAYLTQKTIFDIRNMKLSGVRPEYVVLEPDETIEEEETIDTNKLKQERKAKAEKAKKLWIIDDAFYYRVMVKNGAAMIIEEETIPNSFERVPAIVNSSVFDTHRKIPVSPLWKQVELLDNYMVNNSVKEIYQFLHGYPVFWMYGQRCDDCNGRGERYVNDQYTTCDTCNGSGTSKKKDVSDALILAPPKSKDAPVINEPAGYVEPGIETWKEQRTELQWKEQQLLFSHWGTTMERKDGETATGRFIDAQPVHNKLNDYSTLVEMVHKWVLKMFSKFIAGENVKSITSNYGRRYLIETPDQIWEKYLNAKSKQAPSSSLDLLLEQFYESEFQHNDLMREYYLKLIKLEPFVHKSIQEVVLLPLPDIEKKAKIYFHEWVATKMILQINETPIERLKEDLLNFVELKQLENGEETGETQQEGPGSSPGARSGQE